MSLPYFTAFVVLAPMLTKTMSNFQITRTLLANLKLPDTVSSVYDLVQARISISEYIFKRVRNGFKIFRALRAPAVKLLLFYYVFLKKGPARAARGKF